MIVNTSAINVLCFGDSNTWGQLPTDVTRFPSDVRWPGIVQARLGSDFQLIEEGLSGRLTNLEHATKPGRNGKLYFEPCLESQGPLHAVIIMLGTNDLKVEHHRTPEAISLALEELVNLAKAANASIRMQPPQVILVSPIHMNSTAPGFPKYAGKFDEESAAKSRELTTYLEGVALRTGVHFLDAASVAEPGDDGIHMSKESHQAFAQLIGDTLRSLYPSAKASELQTSSQL